jgi:hypothetical protein
MIVARSSGWGTSVQGRLLSREEWPESNEVRAYGHALRRLFEDLRVDAVFCLGGRPTVAVLTESSPAAVEQVRQKLWNLGATTLLLVETPREVQVFSTIAKPSREDALGERALLSNETIAHLEKTALALSVRQFVRRVETGAIYDPTTHPRLFDPKSAIDRDLLENLDEVRRAIARAGSLEAYERAHWLIGRFLFSCYLLDRGVIGPAYLRRKRLPEANDMLGLLNIAAKPAETIRTLFSALQQDFNGSLFGDRVHADAINDEEVSYLHRMLAGETLATGQLSLFKLYDFSYVPVELISSIYEDFLGAEASIKDAHPPQGRRQRDVGAYYTPPRLAELAIDVATAEWETLLDKRCLDPACGSGVFLVILFVRMAEEWRRRNPRASPQERYDGLLGLLERNISGIDVNLTACLITCFSLYLAFLDQMDPKEIDELRETLERNHRAKILPPLLWDSSTPRPPKHARSIWRADFFETETDYHDLVVGNPPWVSRRPAPSAEGWLQEHSRLRDADQPGQTGAMFPNKELASAFMWKAPQHGRRVCQMLPSRVFLANNTDDFQELWLKRNRLEEVWLLADYRYILFTSARCPSVIVRYHSRAENEPLGDFQFVTPKVERTDPRHAVIPVAAEDSKVLSEKDIHLAASDGRAAASWKVHHWGTPRDLRLIDRLAAMPRLERLVERPRGNADHNARWWKGVGFQPLTEGDANDEGKPIWWHAKQLLLSTKTEPRGLVLDPGDCEPWGDRPKRVRRTLPRELCVPPFVLVNKPVTKVLFSNHSVVFTDDFLSIAGPKEDAETLMLLAAYVDSSLAKYVLFHTSATIGVERNIARLNEILRLPFPLPEDMPDPKRARRVVQDCAKAITQLEAPRDTRLASPNHRDALRRTLDEIVLDYFQLADWERTLVADTALTFMVSAAPASLDYEMLVTLRPSDEQQRSEYAATLLGTFRKWSKPARHLAIEGAISSRSRLGLLSVGLATKARPYSERIAEERVERVLARIHDATAQAPGSVFQRLRAFALYDDDAVHVLKPLVRRCWTRTAALNDADEIVSRMMEDGPWEA